MQFENKTKQPVKPFDLNLKHIFPIFPRSHIFNQENTCLMCFHCDDHSSVVTRCSVHMSVWIEEGLGFMLLTRTHRITPRECNIYTCVIPKSIDLSNLNRCIQP